MAPSSSSSSSALSARSKIDLISSMAETVPSSATVADATSPRCSSRSGIAASWTAISSALTPFGSITSWNEA